MRKLISILFATLMLLPASVQARNLRVAFVGDPQVDNETELVYARRSIYRELRERRDLDLVIVLGDLVNENASLMRPSAESLDSLNCPWVCVRGNHDNPAGDFCRDVNAADTVFRMGGITFVCIDDVNGWSGTLPESEPLVLCAHVPFSWGVKPHQADSLLASRKKFLMVCGHTHQVRRQTFGGFEEVIAGASCGSWWRGVKDADGIPYALMNCGAPRGYFVVDFKTGSSLRREGRPWYRLSYKAVGRSDQASVSQVDSTLYINVYGGSENGRVRVRLPHHGWVEAVRSDAVAPEVQAVIDWNYSHDRAYRKAHKDEFIPMRRLSSPHLWEIQGVTNPGRKIRVRYSDPSMRLKFVDDVEAVAKRQDD